MRLGKGQFGEAAINALEGWDGEQNHLLNRAKKLNLTHDSKDLTAMVTYTLFYNGGQRKGLQVMHIVGRTFM